MFSDGVFAIVVTLLVLEISTGDGSAWKDLQHAFPELGLFAWSFFLVAHFWQLHVRLFSALKDDKVAPEIVSTNSLLLFFVALVPFATSFFGNHFHQAVGFAVYGAVVGAIGIMQTRMRAMVVGTLANDTSEAARAVRDTLSYMILPVIIWVSVPLAFLSPIIGYILWAVALVSNFVRAAIFRKKIAGAK